MNNELQQHKTADTVKWILTLIAFILIGVLLIGIILGWFDKKKVEGEKQEEQTQMQSFQSMIVSESVGHNMSLASVRSAEPVAQALESVTLTATVKPDNTAENTGVDWDIKWKNASSSWANGKSVTSYVTVTPGGDGYAESKTVTLSNLQPFGEQIVVMATARDNPEVTASVNVDYAQKLTDVALKFGDITCNLGGRTGVTLELNQNGTPKGGKANLTQTKDNVYTIAETFTVTYKLENPCTLLTVSPASMPGSYPNYMEFCTITSPDYESNYEKFNSYSVSEKGMYFGIKYFVDNLDLHSIQSGRGNIIEGNVNEAITVSDIINRFNKKGTTDDSYCYNTNVDLFDLTVTVKGRYSTVTKSTTFYMNGYTNASPINAIDMDKQSLVF